MPTNRILLVIAVKFAIAGAIVLLEEIHACLNLQRADSPGALECVQGRPHLATSISACSPQCIFEVILLFWNKSGMELIFCNVSFCWASRNSIVISQLLSCSLPYIVEKWFQNLNCSSKVHPILPLLFSLWVHVGCMATHLLGQFGCL